MPKTIIPIVIDWQMIWLKKRSLNRDLCREKNCKRSKKSHFWTSMEMFSFCSIWYFQFWQKMFKNKKKSFFGVAGNSILTNWNPEIFWLENQENGPVAVAQLAKWSLPILEISGLTHLIGKQVDNLAVLLAHLAAFNTRRLWFKYTFMIEL